MNSGKNNNKTYAGLLTAVFLTALIGSFFLLRAYMPQKFSQTDPEIVSADQDPHRGWRRIDGPDLSDIRIKGPGQEVYSFQDLSGGPLLVNLWATWCPPCTAELPHLKALHVRWSRSSFPDFPRVVAISVDRRKNHAELEKFVNRFEAGGLPVFHDWQGEFMEVFQLDSGIPVTLWIDRDKQITAIYRGPADWSRFKLEKFRDTGVVEIASETAR